MVHGGMLQACERERDVECAITGSNLRVGEGVSGSAGGGEAIGRMLTFWEGWTSLRFQIGSWDVARLGLRARVRVFQGGLMVGPRVGFRVASACASNVCGRGMRRAWRGRAAYLRFCTDLAQFS